MNKIEKLARVLCKLDGGDSDCIVTLLHTSESMDTPLGKVRGEIYPPEEKMLLWECYKFKAEAILKHMEEL